MRQLEQGGEWAAAADAAEGAAVYVGEGGEAIGSTMVGGGCRGVAVFGVRPAKAVLAEAIAQAPAGDGGEEAFAGAAAAALRCFRAASSCCHAVRG